MEWVKFFVESYIQLIGHIALPITILAILFIFRKPIVDKLRGLIKAGKGDTYIEFVRDELQEIVAKKKLKFAEITKDSFTWDSYLDALEQWAAWISWFADELLHGYMKEDLPTDDFSRLKFTISQLKMVLKKIRKERPGSNFLKLIEDNLRNTESNFEHFERIHPKH